VAKALIKDNFNLKMKQTTKNKAKLVNVIFCTHLWTRGTVRKIRKPNFVATNFGAFDDDETKFDGF